MRMGVSHLVDILLRHLQQVRAEVEVFLQTGEFVQRGLDGVGGQGAVGSGFDQGAGGGVPEFDQTGLERRGRDSIGRCIVASCCERVV